MQYDMLRTGAQNAGALAGYAFYNGLDDPDPTSALCSQGLTSADSHGVNVAQAWRMAGHIAARVRRVDIQDQCAPLRCLLGCRASAGLAEHGLAGALLSWHNGEPGVGPVDQDDAPAYLAPLMARAAADNNRDDRLRQAPPRGDNATDRPLTPAPDDAAGPPDRPSVPRADDDGGPTATVLLAVPPPET